MIAFLKLIRWKNILVVALTMFAMKYAIIIPIYFYYNVHIGLSDIGFIVLCLSCMFIMAGGNIINDYFDRKTDVINRPNRAIVGFDISRRKAIFLHSAFTTLGIIGGFIMAFITKKLIVGFYFLFVSSLIWYYSSNIKKKAIIGNITFALLTALIPLNVGLLEYFALENSIPVWSINSIRAIKLSLQTIIGFSIFTFLFILIKELIKDCYDFRGDFKTGIKSVPIQIGRNKTNFIISILSILSAFTLIFVWKAYLLKLHFFQNCTICTIYVYCFIVLPIIYLAIRAIPGTSLAKYRHINNTTKIIIILGLFFSIIFSFAIYDKI